jgi:hypothetical protein
MIVVTFKWLKKIVFRRNAPTLPAGASPIAMRYNSTWIEKGARPELALPPVPPPPSDASAVDGGSDESPAPGWGKAAPTGLSESDREIFSWCEAVSENDPFEPFVYKTIFLPRQARDKHRENSKTRPFSFR